MGAMFGEAWSRLGHTVHAVDRTASEDGTLALDIDTLTRTVPGSDVVVLSVPAPAVPEVMDRVAPYLGDAHILADVCSVKVLPMRWMQERFSGEVVGAHPFFGPDNLREDWARENLRVALVPGERATERGRAVVKELFREMGCATFFTTAGEHDRKAAISQSLHFALSAAYFTVVSRETELDAYLTPSFTRYMLAAQKELTVNAPMFVEFTAANPLFPEMLAATRRLLEDAGEENLRALVGEAGEWYAGR